MLEYNLYDNFNPNVMMYDTVDSSGGIKFPRGFGKPKARGVLVDYEIWLTGYKYTSTATLTSDVVVGDVVEVLTTKDNSLAVSNTNTISQKLSIWFVVTDVDDNNQCTLQNYFWHMIEGCSFPAQELYGYAATAFNILTDERQLQDMLWDRIANSESLNLNMKFNFKADSVEYKEIATALFTRLRQQPITFAWDRRNIGQVGLVVGIVSDEWIRQPKQIRIDYAQNPLKETVVTTERSKYNFCNVYIKDATTGRYPTRPKQYTINDNGTQVDMDTYDPALNNLPEMRTVKTLFYDEAPTLAQIKFEIMPSTVVSNIYFNQNPLMELQVNDLVELWYDGTRYNGHIADVCLTQGTERLLFVEGDS